MSKQTPNKEPDTAHLLDSQSFRNALGLFPTGVAIITTRHENGTPIGLTINSFTSLSLDPPLVMWSLSNTSPNLPTFKQCHYFAINVLTQDQVQDALHFANSSIKDKFALVSHSDGPEGIPLIDNCAATFICKNHKYHLEGDHTLFIGEVVRHASVTHHEPAVFHRGRFTQLSNSDQS